MIVGSGFASHLVTTASEQNLQDTVVNESESGPGQISDGERAVIRADVDETEIY